MLAEIDENLIRNDLSDLERSEHLAERKRLYLLKHPETTAGAKRAAGMNRVLGRGNVGETVSPTFAEDTAEKTGRTERAIQQDVQIAESIPEDVRDAIRETPLAHNGPRFASYEATLAVHRSQGVRRLSRVPLKGHLHGNGPRIDAPGLLDVQAPGPGGPGAEVSPKFRRSYSSASRSVTGIGSTLNVSGSSGT